jgi:hypothetical protein
MRVAFFCKRFHQSPMLFIYKAPITPRSWHGNDKNHFPKELNMIKRYQLNKLD